MRMNANSILLHSPDELINVLLKVATHFLQNCWKEKENYMCRDNITLEKMKADTRFEARNVMER